MLILALALTADQPPTRPGSHMDIVEICRRANDFNLARDMAEERRFGSDQAALQRYRDLRVEAYLGRLDTEMERLGMSDAQRNYTRQMCDAYNVGVTDALNSVHDALTQRLAPRATE